MLTILFVVFLILWLAAIIAPDNISRYSNFFAWICVALLAFILHVVHVWPRRLRSLLVALVAVMLTGCAGGIASPIPATSPTCADHKLVSTHRG